MSRSNMHTFRPWLKLRFKTLSLVPDYFGAIAKQWINILFGETVVGVVFLLWWALGNPPLVLIFVAAMFVAGYYAWRANHVRLMPKLTIDKCNIQSTHVNDGSERIFVQLVIKSSSEQSVDECAGYINEILKWSNETATWRSVMDQSLPLLWGNIDQPLCTFWPGMAQPLNIFFVANTGQHAGQIIPWMKPIPNWVLEILDLKRPGDIFKFDILVAAKDCASVSESLKVTIGTEWNGLNIELMQKGQNERN
jgi:hypothetical protein